MSLPEGKDQNPGLTCQVDEDSGLDAHTSNGQLMQSLSDHESNMVDSSPTSHNRRDVRPDLIEEEPETSYNLANPIPDAEQYESGPQHESDAKDGHETQFGATLRFPSHADEASMNSDKSNKHRAIMKSLFTRLRKSG